MRLELEGGDAPRAGDGTHLGALLEAGRLEGRSAGLFAALYGELHRLARAQLRSSGTALGATSLLHEAYLKVAASEAGFPDQSHFFAYAARTMRGLIIDHARAHGALKRGGAFLLTDLEAGGEERPPEDLSALSDALDDLAASDPRLAELVDLKFFCGLSLREIAGLRGDSERTVQRDWSKARLSLHRALVL